MEKSILYVSDNKINSAESRTHTKITVRECCSRPERSSFSGSENKKDESNGGIQQRAEPKLY